MPRDLRITIIEDDRNSAKELRNALEVLGFKVVSVFHDFASFRSDFRNHPFDLAVVDLQLGEEGNRDGLKIAKFLQQHAEMLVLINTGYEDKQVWSVVHKADRIGIVGKPSPYPHTWRTAINQLLNRVYGTKANDMYNLPDGSQSPTYLASATTKSFWFKNQRYRYGQVNYVEASGKGGICICHTRGCIDCNNSGFDEFFKACKHPNLVQIHRSHVVNWDLVEEADLKKVVLVLPNGECKAFSVGSSYKEEIQSRVIRLQTKKKRMGKD